MKNAINTDLVSSETATSSAIQSQTKSAPTLTTQDLQGMRSALSEPSKYSLRLPFEIWPALKKDILSRTDKPRYPIGLKSLDSVLWGLHKREMMAVGARTSQGKTAFVLYLAKRMVELSQKVVYFSLEMSKEQMLERIFTQVCRVNNLALREGTAKDKVIDNESLFKSWMAAARLLIDDKYGYEFQNIVDICHMTKPDFVFLDYIQMISIRGHKNKLEAIEEYVRKLKELSQELNFGAIVVSQINRAGVDSPELHNFKHAGVLEEHPDTCLTLEWEHEETDIGKYIVNVKKQRHGITKNGIELEFVPGYSLFEERRVAEGGMF